MTTKDLEKLKKVELEILLEFDRVCKKHDIKYFISQGTCLGAIKFEQKNYDKFWKNLLAWHQGWWT